MPKKCCTISFGKYTIFVVEAQNSFDILLRDGNLNPDILSVLFNSFGGERKDSDNFSKILLELLDSSETLPEGNIDNQKIFDKGKGAKNNPNNTAGLIYENIIRDKLIYDVKMLSKNDEREEVTPDGKDIKNIRKNILISFFGMKEGDKSKGIYINERHINEDLIPANIEKGKSVNKKTKETFTNFLVNSQKEIRVSEDSGFYEEIKVENNKFIDKVELKGKDNNKGEGNKKSDEVKLIERESKENRRELNILRRKIDIDKGYVYPTKEGALKHGKQDNLYTQKESFTEELVSYKQKEERGDGKVMVTFNGGKDGIKEYNWEHSGLNNKSIKRDRHEGIPYEIKHGNFEKEPVDKVESVSSNPKEYVSFKTKNINIKSDDINIMLRFDKERLSIFVKSENIQPNNISFLERNRLAERLHNIGFELEMLSINGINVITKSEKPSGYNKREERNKESLRDEINSKKATHTSGNSSDFSLFL